VLDMRLSRTLGDHQIAGDLFIGATGGDERCNLALAR